MNEESDGTPQDYNSHWSKWHSGHPGSEWHLTYDDVRNLLRPILQSLLERPVTEGGNPPGVLDLGCGTSSFSLQLLEEYPQASLMLVDVSEFLIAQLKDLHAKNPRVSCVLGDCRTSEAFAVPKGSMAVVVDKGTVDAIHDAPEKVQMLESAASLLQPDGILISISFATAAQVLLLRRVAAKLQLKLALLIVQAQKEIRLLSLLGRSWDTSIVDSLGDQELTKRELDKLLYTGPLRSEQFVAFDNKQLAMSIMVEQEVKKQRLGEDSTGCVVWPSAHSMCAHLCAHPELVRGKRVVELGAGTGLVGLVCGALGASEVVLTDLLPGVELLQKNVALNSAALGETPIKVAELRWGKEAAKKVMPSGCDGCDVVIGCEVIYQHDDETAQALVEAMRFLVREDGICLMAYEFRDGLMQDAVFFDCANEVFEVSGESLVQYGFGLSSEDGDDRMLYTYHLKKTQQRLPGEKKRFWSS